MTWVAVVPVKALEFSKTRLGNLPGYPGKSELAHAFALDTVAALIVAPSIQKVFVVTSDPVIAKELSVLGAEIVTESFTPKRPAGQSSLNAAITLGIRQASVRFPTANLAVFTGDLPALKVGDIGAALTAATQFERSMVADAEGFGTSALLWRSGVTVTPQFGLNSRTVHECNGHVVLDLPPQSGIRRDVDTPADLIDAIAIGLGRYTRELMEKTWAASAAVVDTSFIHSGTASERMP